MFRAPATTIYRAASRCAAAAAPSRAVAMLPSSHNNRMLSTSALSLDDVNSIASRDRSASLGATATTTGATTAAATPTTINNGISKYFIPPSWNNATHEIKKFIQGGFDLVIDIIIFCIRRGGIASSSLSRIMEGNNDRQTDTSVVRDLQEGDGTSWEDVTSFTIVSQSSSASSSSSSATSPTTVALYDESALASGLDSLAIWQISTLKRRKKMMNKHKLQKRRKKLRLKTRK